MRLGERLHRGVSLAGEFVLFSALGSRIVARIAVAATEVTVRLKRPCESFGFMWPSY